MLIQKAVEDILLMRLSINGPDNGRAAVIHVGGRGGYVPFTFPKAFDSEIEFVLIDAAEDAITSDVVLGDGRPFEGPVTPLHKVVSFADEEVMFYNTECPFASGLKPLNPAFYNWFSFGNGDIDYILGEAHKVLNSKVVSCSTIDYLSKCGDLRDAPSILSIDAQGASLEIISGGREFISRNVHVILCEVELLNFYGGTPSFSKILEILSEWGFLFFGFIPSSTTWASPIRRPVGQRGKTHRGSEDAIFIRDVRQTAHLTPDSLAAYALFCHIFGSVEAGLHVVHRLSNHRDRGTIWRFVNEIRSASDTQDRYPRTFAENRLLPNVHSKRRKKLSDALMIFFESLASSDYPLLGWSRYEKSLRKWGMKELARTVRALRNEQTPHIYLNRPVP